MSETSPGIVRPNEEKRTSIGMRALLAAVLAAAALCVSLATAMTPAEAQAAEDGLASGTIAGKQLTAQRYNEEYSAIPSGVRALGLGAPQLVWVDDSSQVAWFSFKPASAGKYVFTSSDNSGDPYGALYRPVEAGDSPPSGSNLRRVDYADGGADDDNFRISANLKAGTTYYLACSSYFSEDTCSYNVTAVAFKLNDFSNGYWNASTNNVYSGTAVDANAIGLELEFYDSSGEYTAGTPVLGTDYYIDSWEQYTYTMDGSDWLPVSTPSAIGQYRAVIKGKGSYTGEIKSDSFHILSPNDIRNFSTYCNYYIWSNGSAVTTSRLELTLYRANDARVKLAEGTDYEVEGWYKSGTRLTSAPKDPGSYFVKLKGKGSYSGTKNVYFDINDSSDISNYQRVEDSSDISNYSYNLEYKRGVAYDGSPLTAAKLGLKLYRTEGLAKHETVLAFGSNYKVVSWDDGWNTGTSLDQIVDKGNYEITLQGIGSYKEEITLYVNVVDSKDLYYATIEGVEDDYYLGNAISIDPVVKGVDGKTLAKGKDYTVSFEMYDDDKDDYVPVSSFGKVGDYRLAINPVASSGYTGSKSRYFNVRPASERTTLSNVRYYLELAGTSFAYSGATFTPKATLKSLSSLSTKFEEGKDYTVKYSNNVNAGTATVTATGIGAYTGTVTATFTIKPISLAQAKVKLKKASVAYTGKAKKGAVKSVTLLGKTLKAGTDFTVSAKSGKKVGSYVVTITGKGNYTGTAKATFKIVKAAQKIKAKKKATKILKANKKKVLAKKATIKLKKVAKISAKTAVKFKKANKAGGKKIAVNKKTGKVTVKKGLKKGTYKVKVKLTAKASKNYKAAKAKTITLVVKVK